MFIGGVKEVGVLLHAVGCASGLVSGEGWRAPGAEGAWELGFECVAPSRGLLLFSSQEQGHAGGEWGQLGSTSGHSLLGASWTLTDSGN